MIAILPPDLSACDDARARQSLLADALAPFVAEMRLIDCSDLLAHVARRQMANLDDLIQSSLELSCRPGAFTFGWGAAFATSWRSRPRIDLDMEFCLAGVTIFFVLTIGGDTHATRLRFIAFDDPSPDPHANTRAMQRALCLARLQRQGSDKPA